MLDDYVFRLDPTQDAAVRVDWRFDLASGQVRALNLAQHRAGGGIRGGGAFVVSIEIDPEKELEKIELHTRLYGIVMAWMGLTLERA
jgi:hypothetical protein